MITASIDTQVITADIGTGYPVRGDKGENAYIHIAYANSPDGATDFTLTPIEGKIYEYLGQYTDNTETASETASDYAWSWLTDETARQASETARIAAESARATAEESRASAEKSRENAESERVEAEKARASAESSRASAETERIGAESARASAETERANAESARTSAESERVSAENERETSFETAIANANAATADAKTAAEGIAFMSFELDSDGYLYLNNPYSSFYFEENDGYLEVVT